MERLTDKFIIHKYIRGRFDTFEETFNYHSTIPIVFDSNKDARDWLRTNGCSFEHGRYTISKPINKYAFSIQKMNYGSVDKINNIKI